MKRLIQALIVFSLLAFSACQQESLVENISPLSPQTDLSEVDVPAKPSEEPMARLEIDRRIKQVAAEQEIFKWEVADDYMLWSAVTQADSLVAIGYQAPQAGDISSRMHDIDLDAPAWQASREALIKHLEAGGVSASTDQPSGEVVKLTHQVLPFVIAKVSDYETLAKLRRREIIRYVEPMGYAVEQEAGASRELFFDPLTFGCRKKEHTPPTSEYSLDPSYSAKIPWNYQNHHIEDAWDHSTGDGITIGMIDTGISPDQPNLNESFATGASTQRSLTKLGTYSDNPFQNNDGWEDDCGHGTRMAGTIAGPLTGGGRTVGVAYEANFISIRGTDDVFLNMVVEELGVTEALLELADRVPVKIINMSIGVPFTFVSIIADGVRYAYGKNKMIFGAAGTSFTATGWTGVVFPAIMPEVHAVTGVRDGGTRRICSNCHSGNAVEFVTVMQRESDKDKVSLSLTHSGAKDARAGGSSIATATVSGIAALVWAQNPGMSRSQVYNILKTNADNYPNKDFFQGWGAIDAEAAVLAVPPPSLPPMWVSIQGPDTVPFTGSYTWTANVTNGAAPLTYDWGNGPSGNSSFTEFFSLIPGDSITYRTLMVTVRDANNRTVSASKQIQIGIGLQQF
jgi:serine protease